MENAYQTPEADVENKQEAPQTRAQKLAETRKALASEKAISTLNVIWGLRLIADMIALTVIGLGVFGILGAGINSLALLIYVIPAIFLILEMVCIMAYFNKRAWCAIPLHIFSALSLLNIPIGTIFSIIHYMNFGKIQFDK